MQSNIKISPFKTTSTSRSGVIVKAFNSRGIGWKDSSLSWLNAMRDQRFGLIEGHTLEIRSGCLSENFVVLVVEKSLAPIKPLPPRIYFDHFELDAWSGHAVTVDLSQSPPLTEVRQNFWEQHEGQGKTPHFEKHVQPLIDQLVSNFEGGKS